MNKQDLQNTIHQGENEQVEFKTSFSKEVIESLVAFSNTKGGMVIIGVNDSKKVTGVITANESIPNWINEIKQNTTPQIIPDVELFELEHKTVVVFKIIEYPIKPVAYKNKYFKRTANSNHLLTVDEISNEHLKTINSSWDYYPDTSHGIEHLSIEKIKQFIQKIEQRTQNSIELSPFDFLSKFEIIRNNQLTFGAYLLFAKEYCSISDVQIGRFKSDITIIDSITLNTDLFTETDAIIAFIKKHLMVEYIITGEPQNKERFDYPLDAIREIVINMIVHRDYRDSSASIIKIFDDRIEFYNPGKLIGNITIEDLLSNNYTSQARNKLIAKAFKEVGLIERYGSGIRRILNICENYGIIQPKVEEVFNGFRILLYKEKLKTTNKVVDKVVDGVVDKVSSHQKKIVQLMSKNPYISSRELALEVGISQRKTQENIKKLIQLTIIKRMGAAKGGYWKILNDLDGVVDEVVDEVVDKVVDKISKNQKHIVQLMSKNPYISSKELALEVGISQRKIQENIKKLIQLTIIKRMGAAKGGYWKILNETEGL